MIAAFPSLLRKEHRESSSLLRDAAPPLESVSSGGYAPIARGTCKGPAGAGPCYVVIGRGERAYW